MMVRFTDPANPEHLYEHVLWTLRKSDRIVEARTRLVPFSDGLPELRIYVSNGPMLVTDLLWSCTLQDLQDVGSLSEERRAAFLDRGWIEVDRAEREH
jgi:hypothetical protein